MLALPSVETMSKRLFTAFTIPGLITLVTLYTVWFYALQINNATWHQASVILADFESQLRQILLQPNQTKVAVLNIPTEYQGAAILDHLTYLQILNRKPFIGVDLSKHLFAPEDSNLSTAELIKEASKNSYTTYVWSGQNKTLKLFALDNQPDKDQTTTSSNN